MKAPIPEQGDKERPAGPAEPPSDEGPARPEDATDKPGSGQNDNGPGNGPGDGAGETDDEKPVSEEDALKSLSRGGDGSQFDESAQVAAIAENLVARLKDGMSGMQVHNLLLFNDAVSVKDGFNLAAAGGPADVRDASSGLRQISEIRIAEHTEHYVHPPGFHLALDTLAARKLLVEALPPGTGRTAAAFNLLAEVLATYTGDGPGAIYLVTDTAALASLDWKPPHPDSGYLVVLNEAAPRAADNGASLAFTADAIDERWMEETAAKVATINSYMIVIAGQATGALVETAARSDMVLTSLGDIDLTTMIERRVLGHEPTPDDAERLTARLAGCGALKLLNELPEPRVAARLAAVILDGKDLDATVVALRDPTSQVHTRFNQDRDLAALCFALATAFIQDAGYMTVASTATDIYYELNPGLTDPVDLRFRDRLSSDHSWIEVSMDPDPLGDSAPGTPRVRFRNPLMQQAVLRYAWTHLDGYRSIILSCLRKLITHRDVGVRARASVAAGIIAWVDYNHALNLYLRSWAGDSSGMLRQAAANALGVTGGHPMLSAEVWDLLESWAAEPNSPFERRLALTAATAVGGLLGREQPDRALELLYSTLDRKDWSTLLPVTLSLVRLMEQDGISYVLSALLQWSEPQDGSPTVTKALYAFAFLFGQPALESAGGQIRPTNPISRKRASADPERLPLLLVHAHDHLPELEELWARTLARKPAQNQGLKALRECLDHADHDRSALRTLRDLLLGVGARPGRHHERLAHYLARWSRDRDKPSTSAGEIYRALVRR
jgi:hypothetical protein